MTIQGRKFKDGGFKSGTHPTTNRLKSGEQDSWVVSNLQTHIDYLQDRIAAAEKEIQDFIDKTPGLKSQQKLLTTIPGIGDLTAFTLLAEIGDVSAFDYAPQLAAYAGLTPQGHRSGSSVHKKSRISKQGRSELRRCLYMPAVVAMTYNPVIQNLSHRMNERGSLKMEIVVAAMRKLLHLVYGVLKNQLSFDPNFGTQFNFSA